MAEFCENPVSGSDAGIVGFADLDAGAFRLPSPFGALSLVFYAHFLHERDFVLYSVFVDCSNNVRRRPGAKRKLSHIDEASMVRVYRTTDLTVERIAVLYGVCRRTVYNAIRRHANELDARKGPPSDTGEPN